jgi:hypothetical protein
MFETSPDTSPETPPVEPGIDIRKLKVGTVILAEADPYVYELAVQVPEHALVEISSNDPALRVPTVGQLVQSRKWSAAYQTIGQTPDVCRPMWVGVGMSMEIRFRNGLYYSQPLLAARLRGPRDDGTHWSYDVF